MNKSKYVSSFAESVLCAIKSPHPEINPHTASELFPLEELVVEQAQEETEGEVDELGATARASMLVGREHANPLSNLHGGAAAVLSTAISSELMPEDYEKSIKSLTMNLLSSVPVNKRVDLFAEFTGDPNITRSTIEYKGKPAMDCLIQWEKDDGHSEHT